MKTRKALRLLLALAVLVLCLAGTAAAEERTIVPSADWEPPVIDEEAAASAPWLLVVKVAQEEVGYREETPNGYTKYGAWFGNGYSQ